MRVIDFFDRGASLNPERACLVDDAGERSYRQVQENSYRIAAGLLEQGVKPENKVAVYSPNAACAFECVLGLLRMDAAWVPINARNALQENCYILGNTDTEVLFYHSTFSENLPTIRMNCPGIRLYVCIDEAGTPGSVPLAEWLARPFRPFPAVPERPDALASIFGSGGTTGRPKGVMFSNRTWESMISNFQSAMPSRRPPVHLVVAPMTHGAGAVAMCLMPSGTTHVILRQFDAPKVLEAIERYHVTHLFLPPTAIYLLLADPGVRNFDYSSLEYFIYAAAPMSVDKLKEAMEIFGPVMAQTFGQAEAPMICTYFSPQDHVDALREKPERLYSCGRPALLTPVEIMDDEGNILPVNQPGEIVVRGNLVMPGYYRNPEETARVSANGWHRTGDIGRKDEDGFLYIVDRKRDMIISGGFNVYPSEIEQVIWSHTAVQDCAVIGVPDEKWGEAVKAVIELRPGASAAESDILAYCRERLGGVKTPKSVEFWTTLPRTPVGKVSKKDIRKKFWEGMERAI